MLTEFTLSAVQLSIPWIINECRYGTVMGGLLSEKFLDTNLSIPFSAPPLNTPSLQKYKRVRDKNSIEYRLYFVHGKIKVHVYFCCEE